MLFSEIARLRPMEFLLEMYFLLDIIFRADKGGGAGVGAPPFF